MPSATSADGRARGSRSSAERAADGGRLGPAVRWAGALLIVGLLPVAPAPGHAEAPPAGGDPAVPVARHLGYPAVPGGSLAAASLEEVARSDAGMTATVAGRRLELRAGSPFFRYDGRVYQLANPPYERDGELWVPAELFTRWLPMAVPSAGAWRVRGNRLVAAASAARDAGGRGSAESGGEGPPFRVVIDPGHGGRDPGTRGPRGTLEKEVTLGVARKLRRWLERQEGIEASLTRRGDTLVALRDRSRLAIEGDGDLFISIHANASRARSAQGFETYFLSPARTEEAREVAMRENSAVRFEDGSDGPEASQLEFILADLDQDINVWESRRLAGYVQNALRPVHSGSDRGVKQAGFLVLVEASGTMPSVLVETGFLSNPDEERILRSEAGQERLAEAIGEAVVEYFHQYTRRLSTAGGGD